LLADLITAIGTYQFGRLVSSDTMTLDELQVAVEQHVGLIFTGIIATPHKKKKAATT
jgi:hypothetical protein